MMTVNEAAARAQKAPETIRRWIRSGKLPAEKVGTQHLVAEEELDAVTAPDTTSLPDWLQRTATGEPMPDTVAAVRRSRQGR